MKIVIAMDSFKESMTALMACKSVERGIKKVDSSIETLLVPMADGGEGTVQALVDATNGKIIKVCVKDPLNNEIIAKYGILGDNKTAVIEMAEASGLALVPFEDRNPLLTTTYGTGQLIKDALNKNIKKIILGIGGSATNDAGVGMASALGVKFLNNERKEINFGAKYLKDIKTIDLSKLDPRIKDTEIIVACDVTNPLIGKSGASFIFAPQKGATKGMLKELDLALEHYAKKVKEFCHKDITNIAGAGAGGGMGAGAIAFLHATLKKGVDIIIDSINLESKLKDADLVITGEGKIDSQTIFGKTPIGVAKIAKKYNLTVIALSGCLGKGYETVYKQGIDGIVPIIPRITSLKTALQEGPINLENTTYNLIKIIKR